MTNELFRNYSNADLITLHRALTTDEDVISLYNKTYIVKHRQGGFKFIFVKNNEYPIRLINKDRKTLIQDQRLSFKTVAVVKDDVILWKA